MSMLYFWPLLGALIGISAGMKRGFNLAGSAIGGILLGPLAFLMFFMSGLASRSERRVQCPFCAEFIRPEAVVCKHCGKNLADQKLPKEKLGDVSEDEGTKSPWGVVGLVFVVAFVVCFFLTPAGKTVLAPFNSSSDQKLQIRPAESIKQSIPVQVQQREPAPASAPLVDAPKRERLTSSSINAPTTLPRNNPACVKQERVVSADARAMLAKRHPDSYFIQDAVYSNIMESYRVVCGMKVDPTMAPVFERVYKMHYPDYFVIRAVIENEQKSYERMR